jgi:hypothetical protein
MDPESRRRVDEALDAEAAPADPDTGFRPPSWWKGEQDASDLAAAFIGIKPPR